MKRIHTAVLIAAVAAGLGLGACSVKAPETPPPAPAAPETPAPTPPNDDDVATPASLALAVVAEPVDMSTMPDSPYAYETGVAMAFRNDGDAPVDMTNLMFNGYDKDGQVYESISLENVDGNPVSVDLRPDAMVAGFIGFSEKFKPVEVEVIDMMTNETVSVKVAR